MCVVMARRPRQMIFKIEKLLSAPRFFVETGVCVNPMAFRISLLRPGYRPEQNW